MCKSPRIPYLKEKFQEKYNHEGHDLFSSPGRVELLGNHTDHNNGKVLVSTINLNILAVTSKTDDNCITFTSDGFKEMIVSVDDVELKASEKGKSIALIKGIVHKFKEKGYHVGGFEAYCNSTIFKGAGISSSAAFELLICRILNYYYNHNLIKPIELAKIAQYSETVYFKKPCGLLDQLGIALGGLNYIDFKNVDSPKIVRLNTNLRDYQFIIVNTGGNHSLLTSHYVAIKDDMQKIASYFNKEVLREVKEDDFYNNKDKLIEQFGEGVYLRAKHFFEENKRVDDAYKALITNKQIRLFELMDESGESSYHQLKNCFIENENEKLPQALKFVKDMSNEIYSRVHGGGFKGTMLVMCKKTILDSVLPILFNKFNRKYVMLIMLSKFGASHVCALNTKREFELYKNLKSIAERNGKVNV